LYLLEEQAASRTVRAIQAYLDSITGYLSKAQIREVLFM
jgi:hypothetical protein